MRWDLMFGAAMIWMLIAVHVIAARRLSLMGEAGYGNVFVNGANPFIVASQLLTTACGINLTVFFFVYGFRASWLGALFVVLGGWVVSILYVVVTKPVYEQFLTSFHKLAWVVLPLLSIGIWIVAF